MPALVDLRDTLAERPATPETDAILGRTEFALFVIRQELDKRPDDFFYFNIPDARARAALKD